MAGVTFGATSEAGSKAGGAKAASIAATRAGSTARTALLLEEGLLDLRDDLLGAGLVHEDLDARLVLVVPPSLAVVDVQDRLEVGQQVGLRQELPHRLADHRRAPEPAAHDHLVARLARVAPHHPEPDVVRLGHRPVVRRAGDRDLELARQPGELGVIRRPLPDQLGGGPRVLDLVGGGAREMVGGHVADAVAGGLDRVHLDLRQRLEHVRHVAQARPVELHVLPRREMAVAAVPALGDMGELAHLRAVQRAVGDGDAQHVGVELQVEAVHQPSGLNSSSVSSPAMRRSTWARNSAVRDRTYSRSKSSYLYIVPLCLLAEPGVVGGAAGAERLAEMRRRRAAAVVDRDLGEIDADGDIGLPCAFLSSVAAASALSAMAASPIARDQVPS
jgi:hypothetical protein